jgi:hypothetical protein
MSTSGGLSGDGEGGDSANRGPACLYSSVLSFRAIARVSMASSRHRSEILSLFLLVALIDGEHVGEEMLMTRQCAGAADRMCRYFVLAYGSEDLFDCIFVGEHVSFLFLHAISDDDGFVRTVLAASLRMGGCCESSRFCGVIFSVVGRCTGGGGTCSRRSMLQTHLDGGAGSMDLAAAYTTPAREIIGRSQCCIRRGIVKTGDSSGRKGILQIGPLGSCLLVLFLSRCYV